MGAFAERVTTGKVWRRSISRAARSAKFDSRSAEVSEANVYFDIFMSSDNLSSCAIEAQKFWDTHCLEKWSFFTLTVAISAPCPLRDQTDPKHCQGWTAQKSRLSTALRLRTISVTLSRFKKSSADLPLMEVRSRSSDGNPDSSISYGWSSSILPFFRISWKRIN